MIQIFHVKNKSYNSRENTFHHKFAIKCFKSIKEKVNFLLMVKEEDVELMKSKNSWQLISFTTKYIYTSYTASLTLYCVSITFYVFFFYFSSYWAVIFLFVMDAFLKLRNYVSLTYNSISNGNYISNTNYILAYCKRLDCSSPNINLVSFILHHDEYYG